MFRVVLGEEEKIVLFERVVVPVDIDACQKWRRARYWLVLLATEVFSVEAEFAIKKIFFFTERILVVIAP